MLQRKEAESDALAAQVIDNGDNANGEELNDEVQVQEYAEQRKSSDVSSFVCTAAPSGLEFGARSIISTNGDSLTGHSLS